MLVYLNKDGSQTKHKGNKNIANKSNHYADEAFREQRDYREKQKH